MKRILLSIAMVLCAVALLSAMCAAQAHHVLNPAQKTASDALMSTGLTQLQAAQTALQANPAQAITNLQSAVTSMRQAMPIYKGFREKAIHKATRAMRILSRINGAAGANGTRGAAKIQKARAEVSTLISTAISDAQTALSKN